MSEAVPDLHVGPDPQQASVEPATPPPAETTAPAVDESAQASAKAQPVGPAPESALVGQVPTPPPEPTLEEVKAELARAKDELARMQSVIEQYDAQVTHQAEQLALHASSQAPDQAAALKQIAALAAPFA